MIPPNVDIAGGRVALSRASILLWGALLCFAAAGFGTGWRSPIEMANALDPNAVARAWHNAVADPGAAVLAVALQAAVHAPIGGLLAIAATWSRRTAGMAAALGFDVAVIEQLLRWLRPGHAPNLEAPFIAALAALAGCCAVSMVIRLPPVRRRGGWRFVGLMGLSHGLALVAVCVALLTYGLVASAMTPSQLATFLTLHGAGRGPAVTAAASLLQAWDRMKLHADLPVPAWLGADMRRDVRRPPGRLRPVETVSQLRSTIEGAGPGDVIEMLPGRYQLAETLVIARPGLTDDPIVLRAASLGSVVLDVTTVEAFKVYAAHWRFENLIMRGICADDTMCDHAFHVVGGAAGTRYRNLRLEDFNAHFKINSEAGGFPDDGRIEYVTLIDTHPRRTEVPVTPIDLDTASNWHISDNFIADFVKAGGDLVSYGGYAKAAGGANVFERNVVFCEWRLRGLAGQRIGLSFGGGGSDPGIRRDLGRSGYEQISSVMRDNLIVSCSDDGIYINRAPDSLLLHNTLLDTAGIDVRFPESLATINANLVDGPIRTRDGGMLWQQDNVGTDAGYLFSGRHPVRALFVDPAGLDLHWSGDPPTTVVGTHEDDLCRDARPAGAPSLPGAFTNFAACSRPRN